MAKINRDPYLRELSQVVVWDPSEDGLEPFRDINRTKAVHIVKRFIEEMGEAERFTSKTKDTLYNSIKLHPLGNLLHLVYGNMTTDDLLKLMDEGLRENKLYPIGMDAGEKWVEKLREGSMLLTELKKNVPIETPIGNIKYPEGGQETAINALLKSSDLPEIRDILGFVLDGAEKINDAKSAEKFAQGELTKSHKEIDRMRSEIADLVAKQMTMAQEEVEVEGDGTIPSGKLVHKKASEVFGMKFKTDLEVPFWEWDGVHPDVPKVDPHYIFREKELVRVLYAIITNQRAYLQGHTGSGKTTLIEQVAAHMNYPFARINFDSEITRMDLIGRDTLHSDGERVTSQFVDGILPKIMSGPYISCFDEIDFVRPDVAYVMQAALEGNGLRITEDGDRLVKPDPMFRMFATGNTVGQGDEHGMYQGARPQSIALLDRFTIWIKVDYLNEKQRAELIDRHFSYLKEDDKKVINHYVKEHLVAFMNGDIIQPISPRGMLAVAKATTILGDVKEALNMTVLDRANTDDYATLKGLVDRVAK